MGKPLHEFAALLHNGEVGGEVGVEDVVKADLPQGADHVAGGGFVGRELEGLRPGHPHRRRHLDHRGDLRVRQGVQHPVGVVPGRQGAGGAVGDALAAEGAVAVLEIAAHGHVHRGAGTGAHHVPDMYALDLVAYLDAAHALDALAGLPNHRHIHFQAAPLRFHGVGLVMDVQVVGQPLKLTVSAADAGGAGGTVLGEDEAEIGFPGLPDLGGVGVDGHALYHAGVAGGHQPVGALHLHHAHAAGADLVDVLQVAQVGDGDAHLGGGLHDGGAVLHRQGLAVDRDVYHFSTRPPLKMP